MAKQGNNAAYIQSRGLGDGVTEDIRYWNQDSARRREEERLKDNEAYNRAQKAKEDKRALYDKYIKPLNNWETGSSSLTELQARTIQKAADLRFEAMLELEKTPEGSEKYIKLVDRITNLNSTVDNLKPFSNAIAARNEEVQKNLKAGTIKNNEKVKNWEKAFQGGYASMQPGFDENGRLLLAYKDLNGDGENDILGVESFDKITQGIGDFTFDRNFNINALAKEKAAALGKNTDVTDRNYKKTTVEGPLDTSINTMAENVMLSPDGSLSDEGKSFAQDLGLDPNSEDAINEVVNSFKEKMAPYISKTKKEEVDNSARISAGRLALAQQKEGSKTIRITEPVTPTDETWDLKTNNINPSKVKSIGVTGELVIGAVKDPRTGETLSNGKVKNYTYNEDGKMVLNLEVPTTKTISKQDYSELQSEVDNAETPEAREAAQSVLETAVILKTGGAKITIPGQNEMRTVVVPKEIEAEVARSLPTGTIEAAKKEAGKTISKGEDTKKSAGTTYKGLDANGDPIFE